MSKKKKSNDEWILLIVFPSYPPPPPDTYDKYANVPPTYYSPRPRHAHVQYMMPHNVMERPRYVSNAANFRTGRTCVKPTLSLLIITNNPPPPLFLKQ